MSLANVYDLKYKSFSRRDFMRTVSTKLGMFNSLFTRSVLADTAIYRLCPRMEHSRKSIFPQLSWSCRKRVLLKRPFDRGRRPFTSLGHGGRVTLVQRAMRGIFDVKVLLPRLVCSASKFQTSCLWNLTRALLAKATACNELPPTASKSVNASIGKFNERKKFVRYLLAVNKQPIWNADSLTRG